MFPSVWEPCRRPVELTVPPEFVCAWEKGQSMGLTVYKMKLYAVLGGDRRIAYVEESALGDAQGLLNKMVA